MATKPSDKEEWITADTVRHDEPETDRPTIVAPEKQAPARYDVKEELGRGGMATVHLAFDRVLLRDVALKKLDPSLFSTDDLDRFVVEAQITAQLDHPNIVPVHDLVLEDEPYFVMKVLGGRTLAEEIASSPLPRDPETLGDLLEIFMKVCDAIAFAHSRGVVHRDIKPQNIMVDTFGRVYLMDWGLARVSATGEGRRVEVTRAPDDRDDGSGTLAYMAPEQARPSWRSIGPRTDIFALGAILYEMLTGRPPHVATDAMELREKAYRGQIVPPDELLPGGFIPTALSRIAMTATAREPQHRYVSAEALRKDIERFRRGDARSLTSTFQPGECVVREGETGDVAYVITKGRCVAYKTVGGERVVLRQMGPGDVFGEVAVFSSRPRSATVEAIDTLVVQAVDREILSENLGLNTWMGAFVRALAERFRDVEEKLSRPSLPPPPPRAG